MATAERKDPEDAPYAYVKGPKARELRLKKKEPDGSDGKDNEDEAWVAAARAGESDEELAIRMRETDDFTRRLMWLGAEVPAPPQRRKSTAGAAGGRSLFVMDPWVNFVRYDESELVAVVRERAKWQWKPGETEARATVLAYNGALIDVPWKHLADFHLGYRPAIAGADGKRFFPDLRPQDVNRVRKFRRLFQTIPAHYRTLEAQLRSQTAGDTFCRNPLVLIHTQHLASHHAQGLPQDDIKAPPIDGIAMAALFKHGFGYQHVYHAMGSTKEQLKAKRRLLEYGVDFFEEWKDWLAKSIDASYKSKEPPDGIIYYFAGHGLLDDRSTTGILGQIQLQGQGDTVDIAPLIQLLQDSRRTPAHPLIFITDCCRNPYYGSAVEDLSISKPQPPEEWKSFQGLKATRPWSVANSAHPRKVVHDVYKGENTVVVFATQDYRVSREPEPTVDADKFALGGHFTRTLVAIAHEALSAHPEPGARFDLVDVLLRVLSCTPGASSALDALSKKKPEPSVESARVGGVQFPYIIGGFAHGVQGLARGNRAAYQGFTHEQILRPKVRPRAKSLKAGDESDDEEEAGCATEDDGSPGSAYLGRLNKENARLVRDQEWLAARVGVVSALVREAVAVGRCAAPWGDESPWAHRVWSAAARRTDTYRKHRRLLRENRRLRRQLRDVTALVTQALL